MNNLFISETSQWLKNKILTNTKQHYGRVIAVFNSSVVVNFSNFSLMHFTSQHDNLSAFTLAIDKFNASFLEEGQRIILDNNYVIADKFILECLGSTCTYDETHINKFVTNPLLDYTKYKMSETFEIKFNVLRKEFLKSLEENNHQSIKNNAFSLIGFGEGLTPAGDDYLVGVIYALHCCDIEQVLKLFKDEIPSLSQHKTNLISNTFLKHALNGRFSKNIIENNWLQLNNYGYTSGYYTLSGIRDVLNTCKKNLKLA